MFNVTKKNMFLTHLHAVQPQLSRVTRPVFSMRVYGHVHTHTHTHLQRYVYIVTEKSAGRSDEREGVKPTLVDRFEGGLLLRVASYIAHP